MQDELEYKKAQMESSSATQARLHQELALRQEELTKVDTLEGLIDKELVALNAKMASLQAELKQFEGTEELKQQVGRGCHHGRSTLLLCAYCGAIVTSAHSSSHACS